MKKTMVLVAIMGLLMVGCGKQLTPKQLNSYDQSKDVIPSKDGKRHGVMKQYTRGGDILHTTTYANGIKAGKEVVYSKGRLGMVTFYKNGKNHKNISIRQHATIRKNQSRHHKQRAI